MTNAPALVVHYRRFTLVILLVLASQLIVAAIGISIELHKTQAGLALILAPQILVLFAAYLAKIACDRWALSAPCLTVSAEGLTLPGMTMRPIPWTAVKSVRGVSCSPSPDTAALPRHYVLFDVEAPESFVAGDRSAIQRLAAPLPPAAPQITLDITELDASKETILLAVRRFHPTIAGETATTVPASGAAFAKDASIHIPSAHEIAWGARRMQAEAAALIARRGEVIPAARALWARTVPVMRMRAVIGVAAAKALRDTAMAEASARALRLRDRATALVATARGTMQSAALGLRHLLVRGR